MSDDIVELIRAEHERIGNLFAALQSEAGLGPGSLRPCWEEVTELLQVHIAAAEEIGYPAVLTSVTDSVQRRADLMADHEDILDAVYTARFHPVASAGWWLAVGAAHVTAAHHAEQDEATIVRPLYALVTQPDRESLGRQWRAFGVAYTLDAGQRLRDRA